MHVAGDGGEPGPAARRHTGAGRPYAPYVWQAGRPTSCAGCALLLPLPWDNGSCAPAPPPASRAPPRPTCLRARAACADAHGLDGLAHVWRAVGVRGGKAKVVIGAKVQAALRPAYGLVVGVATAGSGREGGAARGHVCSRQPSGGLHRGQSVGSHGHRGQGAGACHAGEPHAHRYARRQPGGHNRPRPRPR